jgi:hypothetical protein
MRSTRIGIQRGPAARQEGRGSLGCFFSLALLGVAAFTAYRAGPPYFAHKSLEADLRTEVSRAGAHFYYDTRLMSAVLEAAKRNDVRLTEDNVKIDRFGSQVQVAVEYVVPVDLLVFQHDFNFEIRVQSFVGRL